MGGCLLSTGPLIWTYIISNSKMTEEAKKNPLERTIEFKVSDADLKAETEKRLRAQAKRAKIDGFRRGKVPMSMIRQMYGAQIYMDALNEFVNQGYAKAAKASGLRIASSPDISPKGEIKDGQDIEFVAKVEVFPDVTLPDFSSTELKRYTCEVTQADVDKTIAVMQKQRATYEEEKDGVAEKGKRVTLDFIGKDNGVPFEGGTAKDFAFVLGAGQMLPEFEAAVTGMKAGEKKTFDLTFPSDYVKHLANKKVTFDIEVKKVEDAKLPPVDDDFAAKLGIKDVAKLNEEVMNNLKREVKFRVTARTKEGVMDALNSLATFDLPNALVDQEKHGLEESFKERMKMYNVKPSEENPVPDMTDTAKRRVRIGIMIDAIVHQENLAPTDAEVSAHIDDMVATYEEPQKVKEWFLTDKTRVAEAHAHVLETKVMNWVLDHAKTTDEAVPFDTIMAG